MARVSLPANLSGAVALVLFLLIAPGALAQTAPPGPVVNPSDTFNMGTGSEYLRNLETALSDAARESSREAAARLREDAAIARRVAAAAGVSCEISEAKRIGRTDDGIDVYETACGTASGYLVAASEPPVATSCVVANTAAAHALTLDPTAPPPASCTLDGNLSVDAAIAGFARAAGVPCAVDEGRAIGLVEGRAIYEIGCAGRDGYRITEDEDGWSKISCLAVVRAGSTCALTTSAEQVATLQALLAGTEAASCVVDAGRYVGASANGTYYEARCEGAPGYIFRVKDDATEVFACADATGLAGGCTLTTTQATLPPSPED